MFIQLRKILTHPYTKSFMIIQVFVLITFSILNSVCLAFRALFFIECSNNIFTTNITNNICLWYIAFYFLDGKSFLLQTNLECSQPFAKIFLYFDILTWSPTWNLGSLSLCSAPYSKYLSTWTSEGFIFIVSEVVYNMGVLAFCNVAYFWTWNY